MDKKSNILKFISIVIISIITIETLIMLVFNFVCHHCISDFAEIFIDATALIIFLLPIIYFFLYLPMQKGLDKVLEADKKILEKNDRLVQQNEEILIQRDMLMNANEELQKMNNTKDKFFSIIAHDLKNPFAGLLSSCELLKRSIVKQDMIKIERHTNSIYNSSNTAYKLLENLLHWSKSQLGKFEVQKEAFNIYSLIDEILAGLQDIANEKDIELIIQGDKNGDAFFDREMFSSLIRNFTTNAIKFSNKGEKVFVEIDEFDKTHFKTSIKDTGIGISNDDLQKLFRIDVSHTTHGTNNEKGTGLGLILCKDFAEKNGSEIFIESTVGKGSTFSFTVEKHIKV